MRHLNIKLRMVAAAAAVVLLGSCSNDWDDHYEKTLPGSETTIYEMIATNPDLSLFKEMVDKAGYADELNSTQTYTVWAPVNSALAGVDLTDEALVRRTVLNHIARFNRSTSTPASEGVRMLNGKKFRFAGNDFAGVSILSADNAARNGVLHTMQSVIPYAYNIREYIDSHSETTELAKFLARFDEDLFDLENSKPIDINENGETVYDSVKIEFNRLLDYSITGIGAIANEDSLFTMVIPTNTAWRKSYEEIKPWFITESDSITDVQTSLAIFSNQIFRSDITSVPVGAKLISTTGCEFLDIPALFSGATFGAASNGSYWITDELGQSPLESWNPALEVEAEDNYTRKTDQASKTTSRNMSVLADSEFAEEISDLSYIYVTSTSLSNPKVEFTVENVLSGKYEIYAYFVPAIVDNPTATDETTRLKFSMTYPRSPGATRTTTTNFTSNDFVTSPTEMTVIRVGEVTFPTSHYVDRLRTMTEGYDASADLSPFKFTVETDVKQAEFNEGTYRRSFRLDRVVLVPVI
ncbi:MAG: hypothetical protein HDR94_05270 [Bacteroides sp.]|nr:hypothetical protein [Bacteroides sp.]